MRRALASTAFLTVMSAFIGQPAWAKRDRAPSPPTEPSVSMVVETVMPFEDGHVVFLRDVADTTVVPISVGETEAIAIAYRMAGMTVERPLTHDLFDDVVARLGGRVVQVCLDDVTDGMMSATMTVRNGRRMVVVDARASDSIALALGSDAPIWMTRRVLGIAGMNKADLLQLRDELNAGPPSTKPAPEDGLGPL